MWGCVAGVKNLAVEQKSDVVDRGPVGTADIVVAPDGGDRQPCDVDRVVLGDAGAGS